jgi:hypothetical protein
MNVLSFFHNNALNNEYSDRDMPNLSEMLNTPAGVPVCARVNVKCKNIGLYLTESSSTSDYRFPIELSRYSSLADIQSMNTAATPDEGLSITLGGDKFYFNNDSGSAYSNRIIIGPDNDGYEEGALIEFSIQFAPSDTIAIFKRLFIGIEAGADLMSE